MGKKEINLTTQHDGLTHALLILFGGPLIAIDVRINPDGNPMQVRDKTRAWKLFREIVRVKEL